MNVRGAVALMSPTRLQFFVVARAVSSKLHQLTFPLVIFLPISVLVQLA